MNKRIAIIVPVFNEGDAIRHFLGQLRAVVGANTLIVVVDGESTDSTWSELLDLAFKDEMLVLVKSGKGRAVQMNAGANQVSNAEVLLFLHADTVLNAQAWESLSRHIQPLADESLFWGRFRVRILGHSIWLPVVAWFMNQRSRLTGIATGDQAIFMSRSLFDQVGGFPVQPLMEDIEISKQFKQISDVLFLPLNAFVQTSGRRWDQFGAWSTIFLMWRMRYLYWRGGSPERLSALYADVRNRTHRIDARS